MWVACRYKSDLASAGNLEAVTLLSVSAWAASPSLSLHHQAGPMDVGLRHLREEPPVNRQP